MMKRTLFQLSTTGGANAGDTGWFEGALHQLRWYPDTVDTGQTATLTVALIPGGSDSGAGFDVYSQSSELGVGITRFPRLAAHDASGLDTGVDDYTPVVGVSGDKLRARIIPADTGVAFSGQLWAWSFD